MGDTQPNNDLARHRQSCVFKENKREENQMGRRNEVIRTDGRNEYTCNPFDEFCKPKALNIILPWCTHHNRMVRQNDVKGPFYV